MKINGLFWLVSFKFVCFNRIHSLNQKCFFRLNKKEPLVNFTWMNYLRVLNLKIEAEYESIGVKKEKLFHLFGWN